MPTNKRSLTSHWRIWHIQSPRSHSGSLFLSLFSLSLSRARACTSPRTINTRVMRHTALAICVTEYTQSLLWCPLLAKARCERTHTRQIKFVNKCLRPTLFSTGEYSNIPLLAITRRLLNESVFTRLRARGNIFRVFSHATPRQVDSMETEIYKCLGTIVASSAHKYYDWTANMARK